MNRHLGRSRASAPASLWAAVAVVFGAPVLIAAAVLLVVFWVGAAGQPPEHQTPPMAQSWPLAPDTVRSI